MTAGREHSESYTTKALAESFRSELVRAARAGESFEVASGLPASMIRKRGVQSFLELAVAYVDHIWAAAPAQQPARCCRQPRGRGAEVRPAPGQHPR